LSDGAVTALREGVRQRAMQVWPAATARRRAERPQPPVAPRKAMVLVDILGDIFDEIEYVCVWWC